MPALGIGLTEASATANQFIVGECANDEVFRIVAGAVDKVGLRQSDGSLVVGSEGAGFVVQHFQPQQAINLMIFAGQCPQRVVNSQLPACD